MAKAGLKHPIGMSVEGPAAKAIGAMFMKLFEASPSFVEEAKKTPDKEGESKASFFVAGPSNRSEDQQWRSVNPMMNLNVMVAENMCFSHSKDHGVKKGVVRVFKEEQVQ